MCSQRVKLASLRAGKSSVGAEMIAGAGKCRADRSGSSGMANSERIHLDVVRPSLTRPILEGKATNLSKAGGLCSSFGYNARTIEGGWFRKDSGELGDPEVNESLV